jgi:hypothetical protein
VTMEDYVKEGSAREVEYIKRVTHLVIAYRD